MSEAKATGRVHRRNERTPEELARIRAIRDHFQRTRPGPDELIASGEYDGPFLHGAYLDLRQALATLKRAREAQDLSLAEVAERSGIDKAALSRLENGHNPNPTIDTLARYADALGKRFAWAIEDVSAGS